MFLAEARVSALLDHPNIARMVDFGDVDGVLYLATELVDGICLHRLLSARAAVASRWRAHISARCSTRSPTRTSSRDAGGRPLGLVHRDVSSATCCSSRAGEVKLADFGVTRSPARRVTLTGELKGKPDFMAPEQLAGSGSVDGRADLFAVGVLLHRLALGTPPFMRRRSWLADGAPLIVDRSLARSHHAGAGSRPVPSRQLGA